MRVGDYVQHRKTGRRGEVVQVDRDGFVQIRTPNLGPLDEFYLDRGDRFVTILRKEQIGKDL